MTITNTEGLSELLPCPFCGGEAFSGTTLDGSGYAMCKSDECWGMAGYLPTEAEARTAWNRRAANSAGGVEVWNAAIEAAAATAKNDAVAYITHHGTPMLRKDFPGDWIAEPDAHGLTPLYTHPSSPVGAEVTEPEPLTLSPLHIDLLKRGSRGQFIWFHDRAELHTSEMYAVGQLCRAGLARRAAPRPIPGPPEMPGFEITEEGNAILAALNGGSSPLSMGVGRMGDLNELVERARYRVGNPSAWSEGFDDTISEEIRALLAALTSLIAERDGLREALEPFAEAAENLDQNHTDGSPIWETPAAMGIDAKHLRRAKELCDAR